MRTVIAAVLCLVGVSMSAAQTSPAPTPKDTVVRGYLVDAMCARGIMKKGTVDERAEYHTRECCLMEACAASGFGVISNGAWIPFDVKGNIKAKLLVDASRKADHVAIEVRGVLRNGKLDVVNLIEVAIGR
jgi:hypothetical protein